MEQDQPHQRETRRWGLVRLLSRCSSSRQLQLLKPPLTLSAAEIVMFDNYIMVYRYLGDLMFYVTGSQDENELILYTVLQAFYESVSVLLRWA